MTAVEIEPLTLTDHIRAVLDVTSGQVDPDDIAEKVICRLNTAEREAALFELMVTRVKWEMARATSGALRAVPDPGKTRPAPEPERERPQAPRGSGPRSFNPAAAAYQRANEQRLADARKLIDQMLNERIPVAVEGGESPRRVSIREARLADIQLAIENRRKHIAGVQDSLDKFERLERIMLRTGAERVSDIVDIETEWLR